MKNAALFEKVKGLVNQERRIGVEILECLYEIETRKAYAELRYDGLYSYCVRSWDSPNRKRTSEFRRCARLKTCPN